MSYFLIVIMYSMVEGKGRGGTKNMYFFNSNNVLDCLGGGEGGTVKTYVIIFL